MKNCAVELDRALINIIKANSNEPPSASALHHLQVFFLFVLLEHGDFFLPNG
jgi:hypothetical protein